MTVRLRPAEQQSSALIDSLRRIEGPTLAHPQCRFFGVFRSPAGPVELVLLEEWDTLEGLEAHIRSADFRVVLSVMDASTEKPHFRIDTVTESLGFERVEEVLGGSSRTSQTGA